MTDKKHTAEFVKKWMDGHEPDTFVKNQHGNFIYSAGPSSINLTTFFEMLLEDYLSETFKGIDNPAEWVEKVKKVHSALGLNIDCNTLDFVNAFITKIDELQAENERLRAALAKIYMADVEYKQENTYLSMITALRKVAEEAIKGETCKQHQYEYYGFPIASKRCKVCGYEKM